MNKQNDYQTIRIRPTTIVNLRKIYGMTGEKMITIIERLVEAELEHTLWQEKMDQMLKQDLATMEDSGTKGSK